MYEHRELVEVPGFETEKQRQAENLRLEMNEITERFRDVFWRTLDNGDNVRRQQIRGAIESVLYDYNCSYRGEVPIVTDEIFYLFITVMTCSGKAFLFLPLATPCHALWLFITPICLLGMPILLLASTPFQTASLRRGS